MNERIDELMIQAGARFEFLHSVHYDDFQYRKFAQLIVRECLDIVANADMTELEGPDPEDVLYVACEQIREHFGVEE